MKNSNGLSVIVPCYNEYIKLPRTIEYLMDFLRDNFSAYEVLIINDGSTDRTEKTVDNIIEFNHYGNKIKLLSYQINQGKGFAIKTGLLCSKYNDIMILDCDLSVKPENILKTLDLFKDHNSHFVIGQRQQVVSQGKFRLWLGKCFRWLTNNIIKLNLNDSQAPYKIIRNIKDKDIFQDLTISGFAYDIDLIKLLNTKQYYMYSQGVEYFNDVDSKVTIGKMIQMGLDLIRLKFKKYE